MQVYVCTHCGSANILQDAFAHLNAADDVRTFDDMYCENCEAPCRVQEVVVPDDFDVYSDIYEEQA